MALNIITCLSDEVEKTITLNQQTVSKICESIIKVMANGLPEEAHTIEIYYYVLQETEERLKRKVIKFE